MKEGRKPEYPEKTPDSSPHSSIGGRRLLENRRANHHTTCRPIESESESENRPILLLSGVQSDQAVPADLG